MNDASTNWAKSSGEKVRIRLLQAEVRQLTDHKHLTVLLLPGIENLQTGVRERSYPMPMKLVTMSSFSWLLSTAITNTPPMPSAGMIRTTFS